MKTYKFRLIGNIYAIIDKGVSIGPIQMNDELQINVEPFRSNDKRLKWAIIFAIAVSITFLVALQMILNLI